ncbi:hypothetical protein Sjap_009164 [Stephania japonica]|uniref:Uncharacterized protein n=1 Tax=Stephania japonica TaxID=461633 RepID=A0AAP0JT68_9MAGN
MAKLLCSSENNRYSTPVPYVGLYIAGATLVCLLLMLSDMIFSFRRRSLYLPCKLFAINSVTLTLLATASKLPVDLTTYMPSAIDQLSKLSSTAMVCVSICFLAPSFGINRRTESVTNLIALSLLVVTIVVNVCIQMYTGVIFSFIIGHALIMCCMMIMMFVLWFLTLNMEWTKKIVADTNQDLFKKGEAKSFFHQVKLWHVYSSITNPQYLLWTLSSLYGASTCMVCLTVLSHAAYRSLVLHKSELCKDVSDYGWSISIIVITQIVTVVVGGLGNVYRFTANIWMCSRYGLANLKRNDYGVDVERLALLFLAKKRGLVKVVSLIMLSRLLVKILLTIIIVFAFVIFLVISLLAGAIVVLPALVAVYKCCPACLTIDSNVSLITSPWKVELKDHVLKVLDGFPEKIMWICVKNVEKWMDASNTSSPNHLVQLLAKPRSVPLQDLVGMVQQIGLRVFPKGYKLSCLSLVVLERIIAVSMPYALARSILQAFDEAFEMVYYIDGKINVGSSEEQRKRRLAKVLLEYKDVHLIKDDYVSTHSNWSVSEAISLIKNERGPFEEPVGREMDVFVNFVSMREMEYTSIEELYAHLEQLFVVILHFFLSQFPIAVLKDVNESPIEVHEEKARFVLKLLCKLKLLEDEVQWLYPEGYRFTRLMDLQGEDSDEARNTENQNLTPGFDDQDGGATAIQEVPDVEMGSQG